MKIGAFEVGGTKMVCAVGNENGEIFDRITIPTTEPEETISKVIEYFKGQQLEALGIGSFGPVCLDKKNDMYGYITSTPKIPWRNYPLVDTMKKALNCSVGFDTDVNASVLGEVTFGCGKGLAHVCYITVGTGIGLGIWSGGDLLHGNLHPEIGHIKIRRHPLDTYQGHCPYHKDCLEGLAAGPAIEERWGKPAKELTENSEVWEIEAYYLAQAICNCILILAPQKIILGGGVMHQDSLLPQIRRHVKEMLNGYLTTQELSDMDNYIVKYSLQDNQGILGCLELGRREFSEHANT